MKQKAFTKEYAADLENNLESYLSKYGANSFDYDHQKR